MSDDKMVQGSSGRDAASEDPAERRPLHAQPEGGVPLHRLHRDQSGAALWPVWNTTLHLAVTSRNLLADARRLVIDQVVAIDDTGNPLRPDAEVRTLQRAEGRQVRVSALLAEL